MTAKRSSEASKVGSDSRARIAKERAPCRSRALRSLFAVYSHRSASALFPPSIAVVVVN